MLECLKQNGYNGTATLPSGWGYAEVTFKPTNGKDRSRIEIIHIDSSLRFSDESLGAVAFKCFGLFLLVNPVYFTFYSAVSLIRLVAVPIYNRSLPAFFKELFNIVKLPLFFLGMQIAALYGVFSPLEGRALFGRIESELHGGKTRRQAEQYFKEKRSSDELVHDALVEMDPKRACFIAFCMQPIGSLNDPHITHFQMM